MTANPIDLVTGITTVADVVKADLVSWAKTRVRQRVANAAEIRNTKFSLQTGGLFNSDTGVELYLDTSDTTTADDGITCIVDADGNRFKPVPVYYHTIVGTGTAPVTGDGFEFLVQNSATTAANIYDPISPLGWSYWDTVRSVVHIPNGDTYPNVAVTGYGSYVLNDNPLSSHGGANFGNYILDSLDIFD